jgi:hypothetical protein
LANLNFRDAHRLSLDCRGWGDGVSTIPQGVEAQMTLNRAI